MSRLDALQTFAAVVRARNFSTAAESLGVTPSAVSKQIARLEDRLGVRLLNRTTRRLSATEEGSAFYQRAARILADIDEAEAAVTQLQAAPRGTLRINCGIAFGKHQIGPLIPEFLARHPEVTVEMTLTDALSDLVEEGHDVAVRFGALQDSSMVARQLAVSRRAICGAPDYFEEHGVPQTADDLRHHRCLHHRYRSTGKLEEWFLIDDTGTPVQDIPRAAVSSAIEPLLYMAERGLGIACLPDPYRAPAARENALTLASSKMEGSSCARSAKPP